MFICASILPAAKETSVCDSRSFLASDKLALWAFSLSLGPFQEEVYIGTETPLWINATVCNVHSGWRSLSYGRAHFVLRVYLSTTSEFNAGARLSGAQDGLHVCRFLGTKTTFEKKNTHTRKTRGVFTHAVLREAACVMQQ